MVAAKTTSAIIVGMDDGKKHKAHREMLAYYSLGYIKHVLGEGY